jgi:thiamine-phosphate diphosphorylase
VAARRPLLEALAAAGAAGVDWVQVRERTLEGAALLDHAEAVARACREGAAQVRILVNRRADVVLAAGLDGVHLGFDAMPAAAARALLGEAALVGAATHAPDEVEAAAAEGACSHVHLAPIFDPASKAATRAPLGLGALRAACAAGLPVLAQGGVDPERAAACVKAGAAGVAVTGAILGSDDPGAAAAALRRALDEAAR